VQCWSSERASFEGGVGAGFWDHGTDWVGLGILLAAGCAIARYREKAAG
jgi:hypothetical protein